MIIKMVSHQRDVNCRASWSQASLTQPMVYVFIRTLWESTRNVNQCCRVVPITLSDLDRSVVGKYHTVMPITYYRRKLTRNYSLCDQIALYESY
jgi:hypothetical protein